MVDITLLETVEFGRVWLSQGVGDLNMVLLKILKIHTEQKLTNLKQIIVLHVM